MRYNRGMIETTLPPAPALCATMRGRLSVSRSFVTSMDNRPAL
jgi:hypothetical protein